DFHVTGVQTCALPILQGVSTGIEAPLSTAYAVELNPAGREGRAAGYISFFVNLGILLASLVSFATSGIIGGGAMQEWGWRVPFVIGAALRVVVIWLARALPDALHDAARAEAPCGTGARGVRRPRLRLRASRVVVGPAPAHH